MKKKFALLNTFLMFAVLFSMLFQTVHSYEHFSKQFSEKKCSHKSNSSQEITHQHHNFDTCFVCNFTFGSFISSDISHFKFKKINHFSGYSFFKSREITSYFKGSLFALRAPPSFIA
ncbi:hypothetical protein [Flavobacterium sp.]|uniref:hypothetical protein n=1 Tax=Flavobacterium sp. TaxID=239 RepID=UPI00286B8266|nr:hypothetical protein [Flavobacterium sp.]